jgi:hypothetical protein
VERVVNSDRPDKGVGKLNLEYCWCVDQILQMGEQLGIYHMLTLTNQTNFRTGNGGWAANVYNVKNGGFLNKPGEYFTDERAQRVFEHLLRYAVARWGESTSVFSWDLWNEVSAAEGFQPATAAQWHQRMARYLRSVDEVRHVIHTNFGHLNSFAEIDSLPEMELVSTNIYAVKDVAHISEVWTKRLIEQFGKPYMLTEYGIGHNMGTSGGTITTAFELTNYVRRNGPNLEVRGMQADDYILLWLKHPEFNWMYRRMGMTTDRQPAGRLTLKHVSNGEWSVNWIDTIQARTIRQDRVTAENGILVLPTPPTAKSVVARLQRQTPADR